MKEANTNFYTTYRGVRATYGRATINYNKKEIVAFFWHERYEQWDDEYKILNDNDVDTRHLGSVEAVWEKQREVHETLATEKWMPACLLCDNDFLDAVTCYLKTDVASALHSDNYLLRIFAYIDRRVGKRTLLKIKDEIKPLPDWVKPFYHIRCEAEGL